MYTRHDQAGYSLLEALVSIMLTSLVILGLAAALLASIRSSEVADRVQRADSALGSFSESLKAMPYPVVATPGHCPSLADYRAAWAAYDAAGEAWPAPPGVALSITGIEHWQPDGTDRGTYAGSCPTAGGSPQDPYTHRLTVEVEMKGKARSAQVVVTKR